MAESDAGYLGYRLTTDIKPFVPATTALGIFTTHLERQLATRSPQQATDNDFYEAARELLRGITLRFDIAIQKGVVSPEIIEAARKWQKYLESQGFIVGDNLIQVHPTEGLEGDETALFIHQYDPSDEKPNGTFMFPVSLGRNMGVEVISLIEHDTKMRRESHEVLQGLPGAIRQAPNVVFLVNQHALDRYDFPTFVTLF